MLRAIWGWCSFASISTVIFLIYFGFVAQNVYNIIDPQFVNVDGPTVNPLWLEGQHFYSECYLSLREEWTLDDFSSSSVILLENFTNLSFDWEQTQQNTQLSISRTFLREQMKTMRTEEDDALWYKLRHNGTVYLHVHVTQEGFSSNPQHDAYNRLKTLHHLNPVVRYAPHELAKNESYLMNPHLKKWGFSSEGKIFSDNSEDLEEELLEGRDPALDAGIISYWKPHMAIRLVIDHKKYPYQEIPATVYNHLHIVQVKPGFSYHPAMYVDESMVKADTLIPLNRSIRSLPLKISLEPMSFARWHILLTLENGIKSQEKLLGDETHGTSKDAEMLRSMVSDTNPYLLAITMTVSLFHILFDWLAFKNDINFWREKRDLIGVSLRSLLISLVSQFIIVLYLFDERSTILVLAPAVITVCIDLWKVIKVWTSSKVTRTIRNEELETSKADAMATNHMMFALLPLILGYALYSLLYKRHRNWYSWSIGSLTGAVYAFGFIMMTPQLVINYKLKSVAHLSWRFLVYRALNTFIDDLFAFIIEMPTMHRLSCFRDDLIFFVYVYQRYIYPVDQNRHFDEDQGETIHQKKTE
uniref:Cleft lip and palate transmembrane family protein pu n=1 Tax=Albugo laibachii Nc14 TaxID=890382 RepID=F0W658_9STRA|nr:cleft lip and palate transmembrane family protein pu [Albugo laibachii Nc14]|eukprot:CCA16600.1 cleft lip and palate transmembrane family protein pu [Albugo laibachii Nc14]